ncbi:MAG: hypothetical protein ACLR23_11935 [Clostridia bacterium]
MRLSCGRARFGSVDTGGGRVFLTGEAAGLISPCSAEGISYALNSALALVHTFMSAEEEALQRMYYQKTSALRLSIFLKSFKSPIMYSPIPRGLVFRSRLLSMPVEEKGAFAWSPKQMW